MALAKCSPVAEPAHSPSGIFRVQFRRRSSVPSLDYDDGFWRGAERTRHGGMRHGAWSTCFIGPRPNSPSEQNEQADPFPNGALCFDRAAPVQLFEAGAGSEQVDGRSDMQERVRNEKSELYEEPRACAATLPFRSQGADSPSHSQLQAMRVHGHFTFGGPQKVKEERVTRAKTSMESVDPKALAERRRFWLGDLAAEDKSAESGDESPVQKARTWRGPVRASPSLSPSLRRSASPRRSFFPAKEEGDLPSHFSAGFSGRAARIFMPTKIRRSPSPSGFVKLEGGVVKFADVCREPAPVPSFGKLRGRSKETSKSPTRERKSLRGLKDFRRGSSIFRRSWTTPQKEAAKSLYERSLTRELIERKVSKRKKRAQDAARKLEAVPTARRMSTQVRRGSLVQRRALVTELGPMLVTHYRSERRDRSRSHESPSPRSPRSPRSPKREITPPKVQVMKPQVPSVRPVLSGWTKREAPVLVPPVPLAPAPSPASPAPAPSPPPAGALLAPPGVAPVKAPEAPKIYTPKEPGCEEGKIGTMRKMSLLPPRKMAELPVDEAQERLKMNLMLFHRRAGDNSRADAPTLLPPVAPLPVPMVAKPEEIAPLWPKKAPLPHFSSLKGGVPKLQLGELQPLSARRASRTERSGTPDASEVNQKAREMLKYLQSFERAPLQRVLSSRERRRSRSRSRSPCDPDAKTQTPRLPPIEKEGGHVSAQAAAWHQFLEQRLGRHIRSFSKSSPPSRVESRDIRSLVLD
ncbi:unnamed protein product [Effrenium voratum]|uniref:Uncharacterized protein n=1 Tax=Effrenium voratum TaxID=2562239 RepID=A0AA36I4M4_9DINO|nr:unnamed protein product [Effrenium voratum]